jgi:hypothetical protein
MTIVETAKTVPEVAIHKGFHRMTAYDMACECRAMLDACPTCEFEGLEPGKSYCCKPSYGTPSLVVIGEVTPKRTQAVASVNNGEPRRIYKGNYHGATFVELNDDLRDLTGITHEMIVAAAVRGNLEVPVEVRRQYPNLFVEIPERFANGRNTAAERVTQSLTPPMFAPAPVSPADIDAWIDTTHQSIASLRCERTRRVALNPDTSSDYDQYLDGYRDDIDYYRWLRKLVDVGGVFHIAGHAAGQTAASHAA